MEGHAAAAARHRGRVRAAGGPRRGTAGGRAAGGRASRPHHGGPAGRATAGRLGASTVPTDEGKRPQTRLELATSPFDAGTPVRGAFRRRLERSWRQVTVGPPAHSAWRLRNVASTSDGGTLRSASRTRAW